MHNDNMMIWIRPNVDLYHIGNSSSVISVKNSGDLSFDFYTYACNFYEAAEKTVMYIIFAPDSEKPKPRLDYWYFPVIYLYRQSFELLLKACVFQTVTNIGDRKNFIGTVRHDLKQSLDRLIVERNLTTARNRNAEWLIQFLNDITNIDKTSEMFRYPFGNGCEELFTKQTHVSMEATYINMNRAYETIKGIYENGTIIEKEFEEYPPKLIIEGGKYYQQCVVGYKKPKHTFYPYCTSYKGVGDYLKDKILKHRKSKLFMPMCYLYRNALELGLKQIIVEDSHYSDTEALEILQKKKHSILGLWNSIKKEVQESANAPDNDTTLADVELYIQSFQNMDSGSHLFRYPCDKNLKPFFLTAQKYDVENITLCFKELLAFFDCVDFGLYIIKEKELEMAICHKNLYDYQDYS